MTKAQSALCVTNYHLGLNQQKNSFHIITNELACIAALGCVLLKNKMNYSFSSKNFNPLGATQDSNYTVIIPL